MEHTKCSAISFLPILKLFANDLKIIPSIGELSLQSALPVFLGGTQSSVGQLEIIMLARKKKLKLTSKDNSDTVN